ncbi:hypothetical protein [Nocardia sp. NPDC019309]|uniref:hypothetical protein n=1 Tax=unclassified Nocardia TaxID=2637762 RepID=UPI0033C7D2E3
MSIGWVCRPGATAPGRMPIASWHGNTGELGDGPVIALAPAGICRPGRGPSYPHRGLAAAHAAA